MGGRAGLLIGISLYQNISKVGNYFQKYSWFFHSLNYNIFLKVLFSDQNRNADEIMNPLFLLVYKCLIAFLYSAQHIFMPNILILEYLIYTSFKNAKI